ARPQDSQRAVSARGIQAGLRAEQAKLREAAGAAQLGREARAHTRRKILGRNAQHRRSEQIHVQPAFSSARLITLPPNPERLNSTDRKSTRLNSSHVKISYAVFCLKKKNQTTMTLSQ